MHSSIWHYLTTFTSRARARGRRQSSRSARTRRPRLEVLEDRLSPAIHIWTGAASSLWSNPANWTDGSPASDIAPELAFPAGAANLVNQNDLTGLKIQQINFAGSGYAISGNAITLIDEGSTRPSGIFASVAGTCTFNPNIALTDSS